MLKNIDELKVLDYIRTTGGDVGQVLEINDQSINTDQGIFSKSSIVNFKNKLTELAEEGDFINGSKVYLRQDSSILSINGHSIHTTDVLQFITKQKFFHNCYSPKNNNTSQSVWKDIPEFPLYQVSNTGLVKAKKTGKFMSYSQDRETLSVRLESPDGRRLRKSVAVLVLETFKENSKGRLPKFINGNNQDCRLENLEWESREEQILRVIPKRKQDRRVYKYRNIVGYVEGKPVLRAVHTRALLDFLKLNCDDMLKSASNHLSRSLASGTPYKGVLYKCVSNEEYEEICKVVDNSKFPEFYRNYIHDKNKAVAAEKARKKPIMKVKTINNTTINNTAVTSIKTYTNKTPTISVQKSHTNLDDLSDDDFIKDMEKEKKDKQTKFREEMLRRLNK